MLRWLKVGQRWPVTWHVVKLNQLEIISLNGQIQQSKWQRKPLQVAHLLAMVQVFLFKSCTCNYALLFFYIYKCVCTLFPIYIFWLLGSSLERDTAILPLIYVDMYENKRQSNQVVQLLGDVEKATAVDRKGGGGVRGVSGWFGFRQTTQNPVCWDFRGVKSPFKVQRGCHWRTVWVQNGINCKSVWSLCFPPLRNWLITDDY